MQTLNRLVALVADHSGVPADRIGPQTTLFPDLDLDSLDRIDLAMKLEQEFGIEITDAHMDRPELGTVGGLAAFVEDAMPGPSINPITRTSQHQAIDALRPQGLGSAALNLPGVNDLDPDYKGAKVEPSNVIDLMQPGGMETLSRLAAESDNFALRHLRRAFDAGWDGRDLDSGAFRETHWRAFKESIGL